MAVSIDTKTGACGLGARLSSSTAEPPLQAGFRKSLESSCESKLDSNLVALVLPGVPRLPERDASPHETCQRLGLSQDSPRDVIGLEGGHRGRRLWPTTCRWVVSPPNDRRSSNSFLSQREGAGFWASWLPLPFTDRTRLEARDIGAVPVSPLQPTAPATQAPE